LAGRLSQHGKYHWQLRSYLKDARAWANLISVVFYDS
jgi:hypothetical protein